MVLTYELLLKNGFIKNDSSIEYSKIYRRGNDFYAELIPILSPGSQIPYTGFKLYIVKYQTKSPIIDNELNLNKVVDSDMLNGLFKILNINFVIKE